MQDTTTTSYSSLSQAWLAFSSGQASVYARDLASSMNATEGQLVAAGVGNNVINLQNRWGEIVEQLSALGEVKILTRNEHAVHEKVGEFDKISAKGAVGIVLNREIDLRIFFGKWAFGFAVTTQTKQGERKSLQFFDHEGVAIHKVFLTENSYEAAYLALIEQFKSNEQKSDLVLSSYEEEKAPLSDEEIDIPALQKAWSSMQDVHQFHGLLNSHKCNRHQAFRLVGPEYAEKIDNNSLQEILVKASSNNTSIMVFVGNRGCIQIHTGTINTVKEMGPWINILDPDFNLHLRQDHIGEIWLVRKPTKDGNITTLEIFNQKQEHFALLCGEREIGQQENPIWAEMLENLPRTTNLTEAAE